MRIWNVSENRAAEYRIWQNVRVLPNCNTHRQQNTLRTTWYYNSWPVTRSHYMGLLHLHSSATYTRNKIYTHAASAWGINQSNIKKKEKKAVRFFCSIFYMGMQWWVEIGSVCENERSRVEYPPPPPRVDYNKHDNIAHSHNGPPYCI